MKNKNKLQNFIETTLLEFLNEQNLDEISSDMFKSAINVTKERGLIGRSEKLGSLFFKDFIGKSIFDDGIIKNISMIISKMNIK